MSKKKMDIDETLYALKYPDYKDWRDLDAAMKNGGFWPNGSPVRLSDPEMRPFMDDLKEKIKSDPELAREMLRKLNLHSSYIA